MSGFDKINQDELNCPCCEAMMEVGAFTSDQVPDGVIIRCPGCGFQVAGAEPGYLEAVVRLAWDWHPLTTGNEDEA